jgi:hypothetical protein
MFHFFNKKHAVLNDFGVELSASTHTNGTGGGAIMEITAQGNRTYLS